MSKLYRELTTEELKLEIKRLSDIQVPWKADYDSRAEGRTPLERYLKELHRREQE